MTIISSQHFIFQSTPSLRKATLRIYAIPTIPAISIHTFLAEGDYIRGSRVLQMQDFNPHLPCGRRRPHIYGFGSSSRFQSTPSLRKATCLHVRYKTRFHISIHTFLAEGDHVITAHGRLADISIHTFLAEGDFRPCFQSGPLQHFNPHLPCGRRLTCSNVAFAGTYFNPHLPCGRRQLVDEYFLLREEFQSTPSLRKATPSDGCFLFRCGPFQSTPSLRKATQIVICTLKGRLISIHTFLAEGDG